jgi:NAD(P)-dependent dehydrogenase (short-subunit alcohol dehydrogenase family)
MAEEGADIIAVDLAGPLSESVRYSSATADDLAETVEVVKAAGGRIMATAADTRNLGALRTAVDEGVEAYGRLDVIVANAGICIPAPWNEITPESSATSSMST